MRVVPQDENTELTGLARIDGRSASDASARTSANVCWWALPLAQRAAFRRLFAAADPVGLDNFGESP